MKKMPVILAVAAAALTLASCTKEQELLPGKSQAASAVATLAKPDLLVAGSWHQTGFTVSAPIEGSSQVATSNMFAVARPSMLVRMATFKADGSYSQLRGARPGQLVAEPTTGTWHLNAAADSLAITEGAITRHLAVAELTGSTLRFTRTESDNGSKAVTYTTVFSH